MIPIPTSAGKEHIVCVGEKTLKVISGKGGAISCDRQCGNKRTKLCVHTIAVAEFTNTLHQWGVTRSWSERESEEAIMQTLHQQIL